MHAEVAKVLLCESQSATHRHMHCIYESAACLLAGVSGVSAMRDRPVAA